MFKKKITPNFLQGWHKHYTPKFASVLLIRSQIIPLTHLSVPRFCYQSVILPSTSLMCCSCLKVIYFECIFLFAVKAEFLCFKHGVLLFLHNRKKIITLALIFYLVNAKILLAMRKLLHKQREGMDLQPAGCSLYSRHCWCSQDEGVFLCL